MSESALAPAPSARSRRVAEQAALANSLIEQGRQAPPPPPAPNAQPEQPNPVAAVPNPPVADAGGAQPVVPQTPELPAVPTPAAVDPVSALNAAPASEQSGANQPIPPPTAPPSGKLTGTKDELIRQLTDEQQRNRVLQGKYQAEVPRLHDQVRELSAQVQQLTTQLAQAQAAPIQGTPPGVPAPPDPRASAIRDSAAFKTQIDDLGLSETEAEQLLQTTLAALPPEQTRNPQDAGVVAPDFGAPQLAQAPSNPNPQAHAPTTPQPAGGGIPLEQMLREHVDMFVGSNAYDNIANDLAFNAWLDVVDPRLPGGTRREAMLSYYKAEDYTRAGVFFQDWARETGYTFSPPSDPRDALIEPAPGAAPQPEVTPQMSEAHTVTTAQMKEHQNRWARDRAYRTSEDGQAMQQTIDQAIQNRTIG